MDALNRLLDTIKQLRSLSSDAALARLLKVRPQALANWRTGSRLPDEVACARIADLAGVRVIEVLGLVGEARATSAEAKAVWRRVAQAAGWAATAVAGPLLAVALSGPAKASHGSTSAELCRVNVHYAQ